MNWAAFRQKLEQRMLDRVRADWSKARTFRLRVVCDSYPYGADYVSQHVTGADEFGHLWVRDDSRDGFVLVTVREPSRADAFQRHVVALMVDEDCDVYEIGEVPCAS